MKRILLVLTFHFSLLTFAQDIPFHTEQQLENQTDADEAETEDDTYLLELEQFRKNPLQINTADADELKQLRIVTGLQITQLIAYRKLFGQLISIYELQAVPGWDIHTIRKLLPFITVSIPLSLSTERRTRIRDGDHSFLLRVTQTLEKSEGFDRSIPGTKYLGSPQRIYFRYRYVYKDLLQFGAVGDKDAGEPFLKEVQNKGFDFYSFHLFTRKIGIIQALALGDFSVNLGQGLIQWQGLAFKKSADVIGVKRQSAVLRPYSSAGEFYFHRGAGITIRKRNIDATAFVSFRKLDGNFVTDTITNENHVSSILTSGYHRTSSENADRNNLDQLATGGNFVYKTNKWHAGVNGICYQFSEALQKKDEPYNLYSISGKTWYNFSIDYSYTFRNFHFFGEAAADKYLNKAFINGLLISVDPAVDMSFVQRTIHPAFQSINGNAFTENTHPVNETGFYTGITIRPSLGWKIDAYADIYEFPWLKYQVDAPGRGKDFLVQLTYTPNRLVEWYTRFRNETKQSNQPGNTSPANFLVTIPKQSWRIQVNHKISSSVTLRERVELLWYNNNKAGDGLTRTPGNKENGYLGCFDIIYRPLLSSYSGVLRLQYFETSSYQSRIYAYENDVLYSYSIPAFFGKGFRYNLVVQYELGKKLTFYGRWAQSVYRAQETIGSGLDQVNGSRKTEIKLQVRVIL